MKWLKIFSIGLISVFFLVFGIEVLVASYSLANPHMFVMNFFSGCLITLISLTGVLYPVFQLHTWMNTRRAPDEDS